MIAGAALSLRTAMVISPVSSCASVTAIWATRKERKPSMNWPPPVNRIHRRFFTTGLSFKACQSRCLVRRGPIGMALPDQNKWLSLFWSGRAIQCLKSFLLEKSRPFLYKTPYATSQIQTEQIQRSKRVMGGIRTPTDIGLMLFCLLLMRIVPSIKLLVCFGNNPHSLIGAAKSVVM